MEKQKNMTTCKHCGAEIAKAAKTCPQCGGKNKKPFYLRPWFLILVVLFVIGALGSTGDSSTSSGTVNTDPTPAPTEIVYMETTVAQMVKDLDSNALKAADTYEGQYVQFTGVLYNIDSNGEYFTLEPKKNSYSFRNVQCFIESDEQKSVIMDCKTGDKLVVKGHVTTVGEVMGYLVDTVEVAKTK